MWQYSAKYSDKNDMINGDFVILVNWYISTRCFDEDSSLFMSE